MSIFTPVNQVKLTNVCVVRLKKGGQRFELACYPNKVQEYRLCITTDLDEILQTPNIFTNVSKGQLARAFELDSAFDTTNIKIICKEILEKGEIQVSGLERKAAMDARLKEVATIISSKCTNPTNNLPYPIGIIEQALQENHFNPNMTKNGKQQAMEWIKILQTKMPLERSLMKIQLEGLKKTTNTNLVDGNDDTDIWNLLIKIEKEEMEENFNQNDNQSYRVVAFIDPGSFKQINQIIMSRKERNRGDKGKNNLIMQILSSK